MGHQGRDKERRAGRASLWRLAAAMLLFAIGYGVANRFQLTHGVADRVAAGDGQSAIVAFLSLAFQAAVFMAALFLFPRRRAMGLV